MTCTNCDPKLLGPGSIIKSNKSLDKCAICSRHLTGTLGQLRPMPRVLILGIDGYIGWALALHLLSEGYTVSGIDNFSRRQRVEKIGSTSLTPISCTLDRLYILRSFPNYHEMPLDLDLHMSSSLICHMLDHFAPNSIIHLAEQPSAPWSMISSYHCSTTQYENVIGTLNLLWAMKSACPDAHLIKLGTMGEYGTPNCDIPEGFIPEECISGYEIRSQDAHICKMVGLPFPKSPFSFYHLSKVHDTHNIKFCCDNWDLTSTDIMQGIVYGLNPTSDPALFTRFDYDQYFGTIINRFCAQAISHNPLTLYGSGNQVRSFLPLKDSLQCLTLAINNPPPKGTYQVFNQFEGTYPLNKIANIVYQCATELDLSPTISKLPNPRIEADSHYYNPTSKKLLSLGYTPSSNIYNEIYTLLQTILPYASQVHSEVLEPTTTWR